MPKSTQPITFIVPGQEESIARGATPGATHGARGPVLPESLTLGRVKQSVRVGARRGRGGEVRVTAVPGEDVVVLHIAGGPTLTLHPATARDLMLAQQGELKRSRGAAGNETPGPLEVAVPAQ